MVGDLRKFRAEAYEKAVGYLRTTLAGLEIALLASFILLLLNSIVFHPPSGIYTSLLPNVDIPKRELSRLYASAFGGVLGIRLLVIAQKFQIRSISFWAAVIGATASVNIGLIVMSSSSFFAFTMFLIPTSALIVLQFRALKMTGHLRTRKAIIPATYTFCAILWFASVIILGPRFSIEKALPIEFLPETKAALEELLEDRDPCIAPAANVLMTPFGYLSQHHTVYDVNCGADTLIAIAGIDALSSILVLHGWMDDSSLPLSDWSRVELLAAQAIVLQQLEENGQYILETTSGRIIMQTNELIQEMSMVPLPQQ